MNDSPTSDDAPPRLGSLDGRVVVPRRTAIGAGMAGVLAILASCTGDDDTAPATTSGPTDTGDDDTAPATTSGPPAETADDLDAGLRVIVVGAGAAGMTAAHRLKQRGVAATVLEAAPVHGGRIKHDLDFADFPIPLGAEWIHVDPSVLDEIVDDPGVEVDIGTTPYAADDEAAYFTGGRLSVEPLEGWEEDDKFVGSSWLDFFDRFVVPGIREQLVLDTPVASIDHVGDEIVVTDASGTERVVDAVIVTVPLAALQRGDIEFVPPLSDERRTTIDEANVWTGLKAFIEFEAPFYPAVVGFDDSETFDGQRLYYDAAYGQDTSMAVLGLFSVGAQAERYQQALADGELLQVMLAELDEAFDGAASANYVRHIVQDWSAEPFIGQAYLADVADWRTSTRLAESIDGRILFAGDAYTAFDDWGSVHAAARSAADAVDELLG
ncbi:MAG: FAD-dependent oxidoreductase [Actinomycetota bacterium]